MLHDDLLLILVLQHGTTNCQFISVAIDNFAVIYKYYVIRLHCHCYFAETNSSIIFNNICQFQDSRASDFQPTCAGINHEWDVQIVCGTPQRQKHLNSLLQTAAASFQDGAEEIAHFKCFIRPN